MVRDLLAVTKVVVTGTLVVLRFLSGQGVFAGFILNLSAAICAADGLRFKSTVHFFLVGLGVSSEVTSNWD